MTVKDDAPMLAHKFMLRLQNTVVTILGHVTSQGNSWVKGLTFTE